MPTETPAKTPATPAAKPAETATTVAPTEKSMDRFRPEMPNIPGVTGVRSAPSPASESAFDAQRLVRILGAMAALVVVIVSIAWWVKNSSRKSSEIVNTEPVTQEAPLPQLPPLTIAPAQAGPRNVATIEELSKPWSAKKFNFQKPASIDEIPAIIVRLPGGALWGFALREPYGKCDLEYVVDSAQLASKYNFQSSHPMVVNPCNNTVYDPLKVGPLGDNTWARGEVVQGSGLRPPLSIDVVVRGHQIFADRME